MLQRWRLSCLSSQTLLSEVLGETSSAGFGFVLFETESLYVAVAVLEFAGETWLISNSDPLAFASQVLGL